MKKIIPFPISIFSVSNQFGFSNEQGAVPTSISPLYGQLPIVLEHFEKKHFSQNGEDGVIERIFDLIGSTAKYYVEFGVENGNECNTRYLREAKGWQGLMMDGRFEDRKINLQQEFITAESINDLFEKYHVPHEFDLLSIDIDYNDFYIWHAIDSKYRPRVVVIEYNATHLPDEDKIVLYSPQHWWDGTNYFGASILSFSLLGKQKGYTLVYVENRGVNLFFVRDDILENGTIQFLDQNIVALLYKAPHYGLGPRDGHVQDPHFRPYVKAANILEK